MQQFTAPPGGVLTREVGAVTGDLELSYYPEQRVALVNYLGSSDQYVVVGEAPLGWSEAEVVDWLAADLGLDESGNPVVTSLEGTDLEAVGRANRAPEQSAENQPRQV